MEEPVDNFGEQDMAEVIENVDHEKQRHDDDDLGADVAEKRWPGWPGESVFRILVPAQRVGGIIGRKGESIKKMCEESRARIKILDGPQGVPERAVLSADLGNRSIFIVNQNRRTRIQFAKTSLLSTFATNMI